MKTPTGDEARALKLARRVAKEMERARWNTYMRSGDLDAHTQDALARRAAQEAAARLLAR